MFIYYIVRLDSVDEKTRLNVARIFHSLIILAGITTLAYYLLIKAQVPMEDFEVNYQWALKSASGEKFIGDELFSMLPTVVLYFYPFLPFNLDTAVLVHRGVLLTVSASLSYIIIKDISNRFQRDLSLSKVDYAFITFAVLLFPSTIQQVLQGNIHLWAVLFLYLGYFGKFSGYKRGALLGMSAVLKIFPAVVGFWFLLHRRLKIVLSAISTGVLSIIFGILIFGADTFTVWLFEYVPQRSRAHSYVGGLDPANPIITLNRPLSFLFPSSPSLVQALSFAAIMSVIAYTYHKCEYSDETDQVIALLMTGVGIALISPGGVAYNIYILPALIILLYVLEDNMLYFLLVSGGVLISVPLGADELILLVNTIPIISNSNPVFMFFTDILAIGQVPLLGLLVLTSLVLLYTTNIGKAKNSTY